MTTKSKDLLDAQQIIIQIVQVPRGKVMSTKLLTKYGQIINNSKAIL